MADPLTLSSVRMAAAEVKAGGHSNVSLSIENMKCGHCLSAIERILGRVPGVAEARANLSLKRVSIVFDSTVTDVDRLIAVLANAGFKAASLAGANSTGGTPYLDDLLRHLAVAGFGAANIMLLSVAVWAGLASDMDVVLQTLFHWLSALIALPVIAYSAQPFFRSALLALSARRLNMDVPISLGILLATGMSLIQTARGTEQVYFDAAVMLTFFLLIGRFLDERTRATARGAAENLLAFSALSATVIDSSGQLRKIPGKDVLPGMRIFVASGERIPVDGTVARGSSEIEESIITGEAVPRLIVEGGVVYAGSVNLSAPLEIAATASADMSLVAEIARLMALAEQNRGFYRRLADRAAEIYAPAVHLLGAATFLGWTALGAQWDQALTYAIAVLIITCPCALALAVPAVQVAASSRLFRAGVILKSADGLERLADVDTVVFDKTGTLTTGKMRVLNGEEIPDNIVAAAASLAAASLHPYSVAVVAEAVARGLSVVVRTNVQETPGGGLSASSEDGARLLGSAKWVGAADYDPAGVARLWFRDADGSLTVFLLVDALRVDAVDVVGELEAKGYCVEILSGDRSATVGELASILGITSWQGGVRPDEKIAYVNCLAAQGRRVVMVGDGLNDAPALAAGRASLSPSSAIDIAQSAADGIFQGERLKPVLLALAVARNAQDLARQNIGIALAYNVVCVPLAAGGYVTPLIAALAMSCSSIVVTVNAVRLYGMRADLGRLRRRRA